MRRALVSVTDKSGVVEFCQGLAALGYEIVSTGGTAKALREAGVAVVDVSDVTGFPEMLGGRIKTLHPLIHGGILGDRRDPDHVAQMAAERIGAIDLVAVNLYAFEQTVASEHTFEGAIESIDIGGPAMVRAAAKNHANVTIVTDPADYGRVLEALAGGDVQGLRRELAAKAFRLTASYDAAIAGYLSEGFPERLTLAWRKTAELRYGENPHQTAALYAEPNPLRPGIAQARQLWGKELSYNNLLDADAAWELVQDLPAGACAIIKHGNPCGAAAGEDMGESYRLARASDPVSAFGGIAAFHGEVDLAAAEAMAEKGNFLEVVIGTGYSPEALDVFRGRSGWGQDVRLLAAPLGGHSAAHQVRSIGGGMLYQRADWAVVPEWRVATERQPTEDQWEAIRFLWRVVRHVKSNAIVVGAPGRLLGIGAGQMNRVQSVRLALEQAGDGARGAALASDAFFPFPDSIEAAAAAGVAAVVQPGGSKKDTEVVDCANRLGLAMVFTGVRHFRH